MRPIGTIDAKSSADAHPVNATSKLSRSAGVNRIIECPAWHSPALPLAPRRHVYSRHTEISLETQSPAIAEVTITPAPESAFAGFHISCTEQSPRCHQFVKVLDRLFVQGFRACLDACIVEGTVEFPKLLGGLHKLSASFETSDCTNKQSTPASRS